MAENIIFQFLSRDDQKKKLSKNKILFSFKKTKESSKNLMEKESQSFE